LKQLILILTFTILFFAGYGQSCEVGGSFFSTFEDIQLILDENNCGSCHANGRSEANWNYDSYTLFTRNGDCNQQVIIHGNASDSYLYDVITGSDKLCSESTSIHKLSETDLDKIETWINQGATEYCLPLYPEVTAIFDLNNCQSCHKQNSGLWAYNTYQGILGFNTDNNCEETKTVVIGNADLSLLYDKINNDGYVVCGESMNGEFSPLTDLEIAKIRDWINGGATESTSALPVVISSFESKEADMSIILTWLTEIEIGTDKFVVEHSSTGRGFEEIAEVKSTGSSGSSSSYTYMHETPSFGENYYRLKMVDLDGSFNYSNIRLTRLEVETAEMIVSPNPAMSTDRLKVRWYPRKGQEQAYLNILDPNGKNLHKKIIFEGTNYVRLPTLIEGIYYVLIEDYFGGFLLERVVIIN
jgi:hypothetical protein|tara:strand:- start:619 stop:1863 length:1245 start_codon:yes stop_codon:yes gene_type:complete